MSKYQRLIPVLAVILLLFGCGKKSEIINTDLVEALIANVAFAEQLTEIDTNNAQKRYGLSSKDYTDIMAVVGTAATSDEIVIVKTDDTEAVTEKLTQYLSDKQNEYDKYRPQESAKLANPVIEIHNGAVTMVITSDAETATDVYIEYLKK